MKANVRQISQLVLKAPNFPVSVLCGACYGAFCVFFWLRVGFTLEDSSIKKEL